MPRLLDWFKWLIQNKILQMTGMAWMYKILVILKNSEMIPEKGYLRPKENGYPGKHTQDDEIKFG